MNVIIANFFNLCSLHYISKSLLQYKNSKKYINYLIFFLSLILLCFININGASNEKSLIIFIIYLLYVLIQFKCTLFDILCTTLPFYTFSLLSELIIGVILNYYFGANHFTQVQSLIYNVGLICSVLLLLLFSYLFVRFIQYIQLQSLSIYCGIVFVFPLATIFLLSTLNGYYDLIDNTNIMLLIFFSILISNFAIIVIFFLIMRSIKISSDLKLFKYEKNIIDTKYNLLKNNYDNNFNFLHNLLHTCYQMNDYVENEDINNLKKELKKLIDITFNKFNSIYTNSLALNYVLNNKIDRLQENKINFVSMIKYSDFSFIDLSTQIEIFSKLLEFGILISKNVSENERIISIKSNKIGKQVIIITVIKSIDTKSILEKKIMKEFQHILKNVDNCKISIKSDLNNSISIILYFLNSNMN